jgi:Na+/H+ antiporter NhaD/arsenite permease-like protein
MSAFSPGRIGLASLFASVMMTATPAMAGEALDGARLPWPLALPFAGILLSIALGPLAVKEWWHIHYAKAAGFWATLALGGLVAVEGLPAAAASFVHSMALEYLPFILMLFALFTAAGGITVEGRLNGSAPVNTTILALGTTIASIIGTTGASMILIQPLIRANSTRSFNAHVVVFFIFLVSNIGGVLTPLGDLNAVYFWATGVLSSFLDNAPTYLVFFQLAWRRPCSAHGSARPDIDGDFARRGVHGRQHLHRQCA